jgi:hypothetical protein
MHVEYIYVRGAELVERRIHGHTKRFGMVPGVVNLVGDMVLTALEAGCILTRVSTSTTKMKELIWYLSRDDKLLTYATFLSPLANKGLGTFVLADDVVIRRMSQANGWIGDSLVICGVDEISLGKDK